MHVYIYIYIHTYIHTYICVYCEFIVHYEYVALAKKTSVLRGAMLLFFEPA